MSNYKGARVGNVIEFEGGYISESKAYDDKGKSFKKFGITNGRGHFENWIASIKEGIKNGAVELNFPLTLVTFQRHWSHGKHLTLYWQNGFPRGL